MNDMLRNRIAMLKAKTNPLDGTAEEHLAFFLHLAIANKGLQYPQLEPLLILMDAIAPQIKFLVPLSLGHEAYPIKCKACGSHQGWCYAKPIRVTCCAGKADLIDEYLLTRIANHFHLSVAQWKRLDLIYNNVLGDYNDTRCIQTKLGLSEAVASYDSNRNELPPANVSEECS